MKKNKIILSFFVIFFAFGCSRGHMLNNKVHEFDRHPKKLVLIQIPGLSDTHFALMKILNKNVDSKLAFEDTVCFGKTWQYDFYSLKPSSKVSLRAQLAQTRDVKGDCRDFDKEPFWGKLVNEDVRVGLLSNESANNSCEKEKNIFYSKAVRWSMSKPPKGSKTFHKDLSKDYSEGSKYFDMSCKGRTCFSKVEENSIKNYESFFKDSGKFIYVVQDFELERVIKKGDFQKISNKLLAINNMMSYFSYEASKSDDLLVLVVGAASRAVELPNEGFKNWSPGKRTNKKLIYKRPSLLSPVFAYGAGAEKFCGFFEQSKLIERTY